MTREVRVPADLIAAWLDDPKGGIELVVPVKVDWPELRPTQGQMLENALAFADGRPAPHPDHSTFNVVLPWAVAAVIVERVLGRREESND